MNVGNGIAVVEGEGFARVILSSRVTIVVDRHGLRLPIWGPLDLFRIKTELIRAVVVCASVRARGDREGEGMATVRFDAGGKSRSIGGRYSRDQAMAVALIFSKQIERVSGDVVRVRGVLDGVASVEDEERILKSGGVEIEKMEEGVRFCIGNRWSVSMGDVDPNEYLMSAIRSRWWLLAGLVNVVAAFVLLDRFQEAVGIYLGVIFLLGLAWMVDAMFARVSYTVEKGRLERETVRLGRWRRRRRWERAEIQSVFVSVRKGSGGRHFIGGVVFADGRRMPMVVGGRLTVGVFAGVLRRELGLIGKDD